MIICEAETRQAPLWYTSQYRECDYNAFPGKAICYIICKYYLLITNSSPEKSNSSPEKKEDVE